MAVQSEGSVPALAIAVQRDFVFGIDLLNAAKITRVESKVHLS
jgi:hypothetical protein